MTQRGDTSGWQLPSFSCSGLHASQHGIGRFTAEFFADNVDVMDLLAESSLPYQSSEDSSGVVTAEVVLPTDRALEP